MNPVEKNLLHGALDNLTRSLLIYGMTSSEDEIVKEALSIRGGKHGELDVRGSLPSPEKVREQMREMINKQKLKTIVVRIRKDLPEDLLSALGEVARDGALKLPKAEADKIIDAEKKKHEEEVAKKKADKPEGSVDDFDDFWDEDDIPYPTEPVAEDVKMIVLLNDDNISYENKEFFQLHICGMNILKHNKYIKDKEKAA